MSNIGNRESEGKGVKGRVEIYDSKYDPTLTVKDKGNWEVAIRHIMPDGRNRYMTFR